MGGYGGGGGDVNGNNHVSNSNVGHNTGNNGNNGNSHVNDSNIGNNNGNNGNNGNSDIHGSNLGSFNGNNGNNGNSDVHGSTLGSFNGNNGNINNHHYNITHITVIRGDNNHDSGGNNNNNNEVFAGHLQTRLEARPGYTHIEKGCVNGNNIKKYESKTVDECKSICDEMPACLAFEFGVAYGGSGRYRPGDCQPQSSAHYQGCDFFFCIGPLEGCDGGHHNLDLYVKD